eukprot:m.117724 g.117724  ORF g.117724 m.117724 type:complete len:151 (+) comp16103_c0_seq3:807-1259(+)
MALELRLPAIADVLSTLGCLEAACVLRRVDRVRALLRAGFLPLVHFPHLLHIASTPISFMPLPVCAQTQALVRSAMMPWAPARHALFGPQFRKTIFFLHVLRTRCDRDDQSSSSNHLPHLPVEMWHHIMSFMLRKDYTASNKTAPTANAE